MNAWTCNPQFSQQVIFMWCHVFFILHKIFKTVRHWRIIKYFNIALFVNNNMVLTTLIIHKNVFMKSTRKFRKSKSNYKSSSINHFSLKKTIKTKFPTQTGQWTITFKSNFAPECSGIKWGGKVRMIFVLLWRKIVIKIKSTNK